MSQRVFVALAMLFLSSLSWSQDSSRVQIFGGYTYTPQNFTYISGSAQGWTAAVDYKFYRWVGFTADFSRYYYSDGFGDHSGTNTFMFGPRVALHVPATKLTPFAHLLLGGVQVGYSLAGGCNGCGSAFQNPQFGWMFGGGLDYGLTRHLALRAEGDYLHTGVTTTDNQLQNQIVNSHPKVTAGVVVKF